jgi:Helicase conserved C-terminal domain
MLGPIEPVRDTAEQVIELSERHSSADHLFGIADALLNVDPNWPRLLVFGNSRNSVAKLAYLLREAFASGFLFHLLVENLEIEESPLSECLDVVRDLAHNFPCDPFYAELRDSIDIWFVMLCSTPPHLYPEHAGLLDVQAEASELTAAERLLLRVCLEQGCVWWKDKLTGPVDLKARTLFEYDAAYRTRLNVFTFEKGAQPQPNFRSVAVTGNSGAIYAADIREFGQSLRPDSEEAADDVLSERAIDALRSAAQALVERGVLLQTMEAMNNGALAYALRLDAVRLNEERVRQLCQRRFRALAIHDGDVSKELRRTYQKAFGEVKAHAAQPLSILVATSTLKVGIDIGHLRYVLCHGVPPDGASYAQRIGRTGRNKKARFAFSVLWCDERSERDMRYFHNPRELRAVLGGAVTAPTLDVWNAATVKRHLGAELLCTYWEACTGSGYESVGKLPLSLACEFSRVFDLASESTSLDAFLREFGGPNGRQRWYQGGSAPNYGIRGTDILLFDEEAEPGQEPLSSRPPEQAVQCWNTGRIVPLPAGFYKITAPVSSRTSRRWTEPLGGCGLRFAKVFLYRG